MIIFPSCKINLGLHILGKREDGFHDIESLFYPLPFSDILEIVPMEKDGFMFKNTGIDIACKLENNLIYKAYHLLKRDYQMPGIMVHLHKIVPIGAGLGGGSADAIACMQLLEKQFQLSISREQYFEYAEQLGSDCAFFIDKKPAIATGKGNILSSFPISLQDYYIVLIKPPIYISTKEAYENFQIDERKFSITSILKEPPSRWRSFLNNDFELHIFMKHPELQQIKDELYEAGAIYASMSGSGSTIYGIFTQAEKLSDLCEQYCVYEGYL